MQSFTGRVLTNKSKNTISVAVEHVWTHPKYHKTIKRTSKLLAHHNNLEILVGDMVRIESCKPISKNKSFTVREILGKEQGIKPSPPKAGSLRELKPVRPLKLVTSKKTKKI